MESIEIEVLKKFAGKTLEDLGGAYGRIPETNNGKAYLFRGKERVKLMIDVLNKMEV